MNNIQHYIDNGGIKGIVEYQKSPLFGRGWYLHIYKKEPKEDAIAKEVRWMSKAHTHDKSF